jgi:hypothetical protein
MKGAIDEEEIKIVNLYVLNVDASKFIKYILLDLKTQIDPNIVVVRGFSFPYHQKISHADQKSTKKLQS